MRIVRQFLITAMLVSGLQVSVNAQVHMTLGGPSTYASSSGFRGPQQESANPFEVSPTIPSLPDESSQAPKQMPELGTIGTPSTAPQIEGNYQVPSSSVLRGIAPVPQPIDDIAYPDPVTIAPDPISQPAPIGSSDLLRYNSDAAQVQSQPSYPEPIANNPTPSYDYETYPAQGDYQQVVEMGSFVESSSQFGSESCNCADCSDCGETSFADGSSRPRLFNRGQRVDRRTSRRDRRGSCLLGGDRPSYMFIDFGGYFGRGTATLGGSNLSFGQDDNLLFGAGVGRYLCNNVRVDLSGRYRFAEIDGDDLIDASSPFQVQNVDGGTEIFTTMLTGRYDLPGFSGCIKPYFSAGVGLAYGRSHGSATTVGASTPLSLPVLNAEGFPSEEATTFAYVLGGGVSLKMTDQMYFDLDYQYTAFNEDRETAPSFAGNTIRFDNLAANEVAFRLRFNF